MAVTQPNAATATYEDVTAWRRYLELYPPELRDVGPVVEQRWRWRDIDVHVDRLPAPEAGFTVVVAHGAGGYGRMFLPFARRLVHGRAEVVAPDLPGYGLTRPATPVPYGWWSACLADLVAAERRRSGRPVVLIGASMGGLVAYDAATMVDPAPAALVATCLLDPTDRDARRVMTRWPWLGACAPALLAAVPDRLGGLRLPIAGIAPMHAIANDPRLAAAVAADPAGGGNRVSLRFLSTFLTAGPAVEPEDFTACPVVLAHPAQDRWTPPALSRRFAERIAAPTEIVELEGAGHLPIEQPGLDQLARLLDRVLAPTNG